MSSEGGRLRLLVDAPLSTRGEYILYWMIAARRTRYNFALDRALELAKQLERPLVVLEALRVGYPWASDRLHGFVLEGMVDNAARFAKQGVHYYPYVEPEAGAGSGLLAHLAKRACAVVSDDSPAFFYPHMLKSAQRQVSVRFEGVDGNGILPISLAQGRAFATAHSFRRFMQLNLEGALHTLPKPDPLLRLKLPAFASKLGGVERLFPRAKLADLPGLLASLPIDHTVAAVVGRRGGERSAQQQLERFLPKLPRYLEERNHPDEQATSGFSPYLHFGHLSAHHVFRAIVEREGWLGMTQAARRLGAREGFWGMSEGAEAFLDQLITWRELSFNTAACLPDHERFTALPEWARRTLAAHASDARPQLFSDEELEQAKTGDAIWNAAQRELLQEGTIHNYLRMVWGKRLLEWSARPEQALARLLHLNNKYALDGRDPNSTSGIFWIFGRYDRPWGPERPVFGTVRYMSSEATKRKLKMRDYLARYGGSQRA